MKKLIQSIITHTIINRKSNWYTKKQHLVNDIPTLIRPALLPSLSFQKVKKYNYIIITDIIMYLLEKGKTFFKLLSVISCLNETKTLLGNKYKLVSS